MADADAHLVREPGGKRSLWTCPKCGERFAGRTVGHSCGKFSLDDLFARSEPQAARLFQEFSRLVRAERLPKIISSRLTAERCSDGALSP